MPRFKQMPMDPSQIMLFGQSVEEAVPEDSDVRAFRDVGECLDYSGIESKCSELGCPPYPPEVMVKVLGYAYSQGVRSSRRIENLCKVDVRFIWLAGGLKPDHNTIARFRKGNWSELVELFRDSVRVCCEMGLVFLRLVSTDGSKIAAAASKRRVYNRSRVERELAAVEEVLREAEEVDRAEDEEYGSASGNELPEGLRDAKERRARLKEVWERLKESKRSSIVESDPDSRVMLVGERTSPAYNMQMSVDSANQVITAMAVTQDETDHGHLPEMIQDVESNTGLSPDVVVADCGYVDEQTLGWIDETGQDVLMPVKEHPQESERDDLFASRCFLRDGVRDVLICPAGRELTFKREHRCGSGLYRTYAVTGCQSCSFHQQCVGRRSASRRVSVSVVSHVRERLRDRLRSAEGRALYALRQQTIEPVFGQMKSNLGFDRFLTWGLQGATAEAALMCLAHNMSKCAAKAAALTHFLVVARVQTVVGQANRWFRRFLGGSSPQALTAAARF
jgi:transposase